MLVSDLMTTPVVTVTAPTGIKEAARLLRDRDVAAVPVVDDAGALVGIVSEIDLLRGSVLPDPVAHLVPVDGPTGRPPTTVADVMTVEVEVLDPHTDLYDAARRMRSSGLRSLPVVDDGQVVGVLSRADLLRVLARDDDEIAADVRRRLAEEFGRVPAEVRVERGVVSLSGLTAEAVREGMVLVSSRVPGVVRVQVAEGP